ncbi:MAG: serine protease [Candidatus Scalindua rubra]|nr:serine protease [Candidatus Scalindua rubra]TWU31082.1 putative periplasmic serine endoprotease DegP-like precursor [Candidatus Brocadiaceae bacterium S225]
MKKNINNKVPYYRYIAYISFCFVLLLTGDKVTAQNHGASLIKTLKKVKPAIIAVGTYHPLSKPPVKFFGTGFVYSTDGYAITAAHVINAIYEKDDIDNLNVFFPATGNSRKIRAKIVVESQKHDLSIIKLTGSNFNYVDLGDSSKVEDGQSIALCGYPYGPVFGLYPTTHTGIISNISPMAIPVQNTSFLTNRMITALNDPYTIFQLDCTAFPGNSGGPLFLPETGEVIGVLNSAFVKITKENKQVSTGISYAIPINYAKELMESSKK